MLEKILLVIQYLLVLVTNPPGRLVDGMAN